MNMRQRRFLQICVGAAGLIPVSAGIAGIYLGPGLVDAAVSPTADSHFRYLSGLLLGIGLLAWSAIPRIEASGKLFRILTLLVFIGGLGRLWSLVAVGIPSVKMLSALAMELVVTPLLCWWQWRISKGRVWAHSGDSEPKY